MTTDCQIFVSVGATANQAQEAFVCASKIGFELKNFHLTPSGECSPQSLRFEPSLCSRSEDSLKSQQCSKYERWKPDL